MISSASILSKQLQNAVAHLKAQRIVVQDSDIVNATGYSKSQVSNYLSGKISPSKPFVAVFETAYGLSLADYNKPIEHENIIQKLLKYQAMQLRLLALIAQETGIDKKKVADIISQDKKIMGEYFDTLSEEKTKEKGNDPFAAMSFVKPRKLKN